MHRSRHLTASPALIGVAVVASLGVAAGGSIAFASAGKPGPPRHVLFDRTSSTSGKVTWNVPAKNGGSPILGYKITVTNYGDSKSKTVGAHTFAVTFSNAKGHCADAEVRARNANGYGAEEGAQISASGSPSPACVGT